MTKILKLDSRAVISITGEDGIKFLQGLITNDANKISDSTYTYAFMLTPQGRFLYDFFITKVDDTILLDCQKARMSEILKKFKLYKLKSKIEILETDLNVYYSGSPISPNSLPDPRNSSLGFRTITSDSLSSTTTQESYDLMRINLCIPDAELDLIYERTLPLEIGGLQLNAIDLAKGCYVGQEVTSRMNYRANIRKKIYLIEFTGTPPAKEEELILDDKKIGIFLGVVSNLTLGLLNMEEVSKLINPTYTTNNRTIRICTN